MLLQPTLHWEPTNKVRDIRRLPGWRADVRKWRRRDQVISFPEPGQYAWRICMSCQEGAGRRTENGSGKIVVVHHATRRIGTSHIDGGKKKLLLIGDCWCSIMRHFGTIFRRRPRPLGSISDRPCQRDTQRHLELGRGFFEKIVQENRRRRYIGTQHEQCPRIVDDFRRPLTRQRVGGDVK